MDRIVKIMRILLIVFFIVWGVIWFSIRAFTEVEKGNDNIPNSIAVQLYKTPYLLKQWYKESVKNSYQAVPLEQDKDLYEIGMMEQIENVPESTYLLHSKYINEELAEVVLQNIKTGEIKKKWDISLTMIQKDLDSIRKDLNKKSSLGMATRNIDFYMPSKSTAILVRTPMFLKDSSLLFHVSYLGHIYKIDKNSNLLWKSKRLTHHSLEIDEDENLWTCSTDFENQTTNNYKIRDDAILGLNKNGEEIYFESLTNIYKNNDFYKKLIESTPFRETKSGLDPFHLNDVQPVKSDGKYWKKGDLFLSVRDKSMAVLYRPSTGKIIWFEQGPWTRQHDITIENDSVISIFNNNTSFFNNKVNTSSNIVTYYFNDNSSKYFADNMFNSPTEGRQIKINTGDYLIEETRTGIYHIINEDEELVAKFYVPFINDKTSAQYPAWSRVYYEMNNTIVEQ